MKQVREGIDVRTSPLRSTRPAFAARLWCGSPISTMPSLGEGHAKGHEAILANGTRRLKEPST